MSFEVDMSSFLDLGAATLLLILSHDVDDQRKDTENILAAAGGTLATYPAGPVFPVALGSAIYCDGSISITAGGLSLVGPIGFTIGEVALMKKAMLFVNDKSTFDPNDHAERIWMAVSLSLEILDKDEE